MDTAQFNHKDVTNPTVTHVDKIMQAILSCEIGLKRRSNRGINLEMWQLEQLKELTKKAVAQGSVPTETTLSQLGHNIEMTRA
jgi:hypothetical protein